MRRIGTAGEVVVQFENVCARSTVVKFNNSLARVNPFFGE